MCAEACPFNAIEVTQDLGAQVDDILCRGCGLCASVCPSEAITVRYYRGEQFDELLDGMLDGVLEETPSS
jgi:heterodisulfide reductase subunit A